MGTYCDQCNKKVKSTYKPTTCKCYTKLDKDGYLVYSYEGFCKSCWTAKFKDPSISACSNCGRCPNCRVKFKKGKVKID